MSMKCPKCGKEMFKSKTVVTGWKVETYKIWLKAYKWICKEHRDIYVIESDDAYDYTQTVKDAVMIFDETKLSEGTQMLMRKLNSHQFIEVEPN